MHTLLTTERIVTRTRGTLTRTILIHSWRVWLWLSASSSTSTWLWSARSFCTVTSCRIMFWTLCSRSRLYARARLCSRRRHRSRSSRSCSRWCWLCWSSLSGCCRRCRSFCWASWLCRFCCLLCLRSLFCSGTWLWCCGLRIKSFFIFLGCSILSGKCCLKFTSYRELYCGRC